MQFASKKYNVRANADNKTNDECETIKSNPNILENASIKIAMNSVINNLMIIIILNNCMLTM